MAHREHGEGWGRRGLARGLIVAAGLLLVNGLGCGNDSSHGRGESKTGPDGGAGGGSGIAEPGLNVQGGTATSPGGQGQNGGVVHLLAKGDVTFDPSQAPAIPDAPSSAMAVDAAALAADVSISGDAVIDGDVTIGGAGAVRKIAASGNLYVRGKVRSADLGATRQGLDLQAGGAVYVAGTVDTSGAAGSGQAGGNVSVHAGGDVVLAGTVRFGGGAAAQGGAGATLAIDADGTVQLGGIIDGHGGAASAGGGAVVGGAAGAVRVGESAAPTAISVLVPVVATGGDGDASAGAGGTVTPEPATGNVTIAGAHEIDVSGGSSLAAPGAGGLLSGGPRTDPGSGGIHITGEIVASGGSIRAGGSGNGADGGRVDFQLIPTDGAVMIDQGAIITVEGGASGGAGTAGGGGHVWFFTKDGDATIGGTISVKGGNAPDPGGVGGLGGMIYFFTDNNHDAINNNKGNLLVAATGLLDASGGMGATGGNGRSNGIPNLVPSFPDNQEQIAIFLNCDGAHGNTLNWMENDGRLIARGGAHNGAGGDIVYHGIPPGVYGTGGAGSGDYPVPSGNIDTAGDGSGPPGDFDGE